MPIKEEPLTVAEQVAVNQLRRWPTMYKSGRDFFHQCVIGGQGDFYWENGLLHTDERKYVGQVAGKNKFIKYPFEISEDVAKRLLRDGNRGFPYVYPLGECPIDKIPDDVHPEWLQFISNNLYKDAQLTPDLYRVLAQANCIMWYGIKSNPNASDEHYISEWSKYHAKIPSYQAHIRLIEDIRVQGQIPPDRYQGIDI